LIALMVHARKDISLDLPIVQLTSELLFQHASDQDSDGAATLKRIVLRFMGALGTRYPHVQRTLAGEKQFAARRSVF
jgi:hypothetical protein